MQVPRAPDGEAEERERSEVQSQRTEETVPGCFSGNAEGFSFTEVVNVELREGTGAVGEYWASIAGIARFEG